MTLADSALIFASLIGTQFGSQDATEELWRNPAVNQWHFTRSITEVGGTFYLTPEQKNSDPRSGTGGFQWSLGANTYTKYKSSTLWGEGRYSNSLTHNVVWNETADASLLYPYLLADSIGGNLRSEQYSFKGGYADRSEDWAWGAEISYVATQQYRSVDPRPRNVVGCLDIAAGGLRRIAGSYFAGLGLGFRKYKQTNEIDFKSEMGVDKVFHLTGLGNRYNRFDGAGLATYYDGYRFSLDADIFPASGKGAFAMCRISKFSFTNILTGLNKLPLATAWHNQLTAQAGWLAKSDKTEAGISAMVDVYRRHGTENIFGDAASSIYPQIAANEMYADNYVATSLTALWERKFTELNRLQCRIIPAWTHQTIAYVQPYSYEKISNFSISAKVAGSWQPAAGWLLTARVATRLSFPSDCIMALAEANPEMAGLIKIEEEAFKRASSGTTQADAGIACSRAITSKYAVNIDAGCAFTHYRSVNTEINYNIKISFIF